MIIMSFTENPFKVPAPPDWPVDTIEYVVVEDRLRMLKTMTADQLRQAIAWCGSQTTVIKAAQSRLNRLEKQASKTP